MTAGGALVGAADSTLAIASENAAKASCYDRLRMLGAGGSVH